VNRVHLYVLSSVLVLIGLGLFLYKAYVLNFPLRPAVAVEVWNVEARIKFVAQDQPVKVSLFIPGRWGQFAVVDEHFISQGYGLVASMEEGNRQAQWSIRRANGKQNLYYRAVIMAARTPVAQPQEKTPTARPAIWKGPKLQAATTIMDEVKAKSADTRSMVTNLLRKLHGPQGDGNLKVLLRPQSSEENKVRVAVRLLELTGIPARLVRGIQLDEGKRWFSFNPQTGKSPVPKDWLRWWEGPKKMVELEGGQDLVREISVSPKLEQSVIAAVRHGQRTRPLLLKFSLFSLPVKSQAVYRVMLLIPVGALLLVLLRNVVGIKTFGTFMPVLIALSFRETGLAWGIVLFTAVVACGLSVRFYLERLKLLLVPRLAAVLIVVVLVMAALSVLTNLLGLQVGLSVALFPMVILTMTIERMSILWEELGAREALVSGLGSLLTAALAFVVMNINAVEHLVFVFPELLLVLLAATLLLGRYSGYRLMDLYRFRELARG
jgi:7 transmembrane helices usually fused to an inactive transglutaminase/Inactive transglutaminase fused to 7 transmembrane helices